MSVSDTIVALSSGAPPSGVAIIRVSGPATRELLERFAGGVSAPRKLSLRTLGNGLDRGLVAWFPAPHSFTGEDCAEFHAHGSPAVVRALLRTLSSVDGVRLAQAGEFTRRAFENGRLDLTEVEGLGDLIVAETESQRSQALARLSGGLSNQLEVWRERILDLRAEVEARLDFADEGDVRDLPADFRERLVGLRQELAHALSGATGGRIVREGFRVALAGPPNAGKSSLLNALARAEVAIVTDEPGTTRDVREVPLDLGGQLVVLLDLAGLRETASKAEAEGVRRARAEIADADLVLWLVAPDVQELPYTEGAVVWHIGTKADLVGSRSDVDLMVSAHTGVGLDALLARLAELASDKAGDPATALVSRERDIASLQQADVALEEAMRRVEDLELCAESLRQASNALERLLGRMDPEAVLDRLFLSFCIGK